MTLNEAHKLCDYAKLLFKMAKIRSTPWVFSETFLASGTSNHTVEIRDPVMTDIELLPDGLKEIARELNDDS